MKIFLYFLLGQSSLFAGEMTFQGPCEERPFLSSREVTAGASVGEMTIATLKKSQISFVGNVAGINSIMGTPIGDGAKEVISDTHMRAYGWCYEVDGFRPATMPDKIILKGTENIRWFFAYSNYQDGTWRDYCTPSYTIKPKFLCP